MKQQYAFLDRDGALIFEPLDDSQVDSLEKLKILDGVLTGLQFLIQNGYKLIMVTNQNGIGTDSFPTEDFEIPQKKMLEIFRENGIGFEEIFICPHFQEDNCRCRKPKTGLVDEWIQTADIDYKNSFMYGDRATDGGFAENIGISFIKTEKNGAFRIDAINDFIHSS